MFHFELDRTVLEEEHRLLARIMEAREPVEMAVIIQEAEERVTAVMDLFRYGGLLEYSLESFRKRGAGCSWMSGR